MELQLSKPNALQKQITVVQMQHKNKFAVSLENPKLRDYPEEVRNANTANLVDWLLNLLGVNEKNGSTDQHVAAFNHIHRTLDVYTYQEIILAFEMYVNGEFTDKQGRPIEVFSEFNARVIGRVMKLYTEKKRENLTAYYQQKQMQKNKLPEISEAEKKKLIENGIIECFNDYKETKEIKHGRLYVYEELYKRNLLPPHTPEFKAEIEKRAKVKVLRQAEQTIKSGKLDENTHKAKKLIARVQEGKQSFKRDCRRIIIQDFFDKLLSESEDFDIKLLLIQ
tara:strand:- start:17 stop:856 length:840 start_codon:yes stop_codon:yes gene_type:complete